MADSSKKPDALNPITVLREAIRAVPAVKYALGIAGIVSAIAIVTGGFRIDLRIAVFGTVIMFVLMTVLVLFARLATTPHHALGIAVIVLVWFSLLLTISTATGLFTSVFFHLPLDLGRWPLQTPTMSDNHNPNLKPECFQSLRLCVSFMLHTLAISVLILVLVWLLTALLLYYSKR